MTERVQQLGDARRGKLAGNLAGFGRALRRAGVRTDAMRIGLAAEAAMLVGVDSRGDLASAMEAVMISREEDRGVFRELFDAWFRDPELANKLLAQMLPSAEGKAEPSKRRPRVREALAAPRDAVKPAQTEREIDFDAAMTASDRQRVHHADFNALGAAEYRLVERLARDIALPVPTLPSRRLRVAGDGGVHSRMHWPGVLHEAARTGGEMLRLPKLSRRRQPLPLLVLIDVSGSMERYARLLLAFLHASTRRAGRRDVFAFGTHLTDLTPAFRIADTDAMLAAAGAAIDDFAGGTRLGDSLAQLRHRHARRLTGRRTLVLVISDGLDTGEPEALEHELLWLKRHSRRVLWLNPLLRYEGYAPLARGAAMLHRHADAMLAVHNLSALEQLASSLAALMRAGR
ncbi:vWA domain-containing protein [Variovorax ginsengisoli]|uniref:VWA domain-containing protein n=1 Tax=Variovorax ginsengisoli TaxID=363844 RepID=A0ABT8S3C3_9BURK|nr:VWA domain-containing protein [Variovorax ginsengisoli]MDN8612691.1 VWA domain-containing protein [Variovorax ginsengisoli]MDO1531861.1 VWA domain-containing protein [Variovorax ginsengisoli]